MNELKVGQLVYERTKNGIKEHTITKVGRKLFDIGDYRDRFRIEDLRYEDKMYSQHNRKLYLSREEIEEEDKLNHTKERVRGNFSSYSHSDKRALTPKQWFAIEQIIFGDEFVSVQQ